MIELEIESYHSARPVFAGLEHCIPVWAVLEGSSPGRVLVDSASEPRLGIIWGAWGYYYLGGQPVEVESAREIRTLLDKDLVPASVALGERGLVLYPAPGDCEVLAGEVLSGRSPLQIFRRHFRFNPDQFRISPAWQAQSRTETVLHRIDAALLDRPGQALVGELEATWGSKVSFLQHGLGFCLLSQDELASACYAVFVAGGRAEVSVFTAEVFRRQGLATRVSAAFIDSCLELGLVPNWECFWDNTASDALARKLGYEQAVDYPVFYWEEGGE